MLKNLKRTLIIFSIILILITSCGLVSASSDVDDDVSLSEGTNDDVEIVESNVDYIETSEETVIAEDSLDFKNVSEKTKTISKESAPVSGGTFVDIQNAIDSAKSGDTIELSGTYTGEGDYIYISKSITIDGKNQTTLDAKGLSRIFKVGGNNVVIKNMNLINGYYGGYGGAIYVDEANNFNLINCNFINNTIYSDYDGSYFINPYYGFGGAVYSNGNKCTITSCTFKNNTAYSEVSGGFTGSGIGGALALRDNAKITDCVFENNFATRSGGGVYIWGTNAILTNCNFTDCSVGDTAADNEGGAVYVDEDARFKNCNFINNYASDEGGAVQCQFNCSFENCGFIGNVANNGGAVTCFENNTFKNCSFISNYANKYETINICRMRYTIDFNILNSTFYDNDYSDMNVLSVKNNTLIINFNDYYFEGLGGDYKLYVSDKVLSGKLYEKTEIDLSGLPSGNFNGRMIYHDENGKVSEMNIPLTIISNYDLQSSNITKYYGGSEKYSVTLTKDNVAVSNAKVNVTINGKTSTVTTNNKGQASLDLNLTVGTYDAIAKYDGVEAKSKVTVKSTVTSSDSTGTYLNSKVSATFLDTAGKALANTKVSFKAGSKTYTATTNNNGVATASVDLDVGTYTVTAINPKNNEQKTSKLTISKAKSTVTLTATSNNDVVTLTASLSPSTASGNVIFNINNKNYTAKISSAKASQTITGLNLGNYTAKASYAGDKNLNSSSASTKVEVKKVIATKIIYEDMQTGPVPKSEGRIGNYFCVKLVDDKGKAIAGVPIKIGFNGVIYNRTTMSDGSARLQINLANEDLYTFAICFLGDDDYQAAFEVAKIDVNKKYPKPNLANKTTDATNASATQHESRLKTYISYNNMDTKSVLKVEGRAGEYFVVKLLDNNKKALADVPIKIGFNGVIYNRTTNATGEARLQINLLKPTLYTFAIAYLGDSKYQAAFEVAKITVKAQTPKLTSASKTFKASAKTKSLSATLVSARGTPISGQKLSFTVNGKTYTGKTNSKGVATVNISLNKKGTYSCSVKFAGMTGASAKTTKLAVKIT